MKEKSFINFYHDFLNSKIICSTTLYLSIIWIKYQSKVNSSVPLFECIIKTLPPTENLQQILLFLIISPIIIEENLL